MEDNDTQDVESDDLTGDSQVDTEGSGGEDQSSEPAPKEINWQKRYEDLRPEWDRAKTQLSEFEQYQPLIQSLQNDPQGTIRALQKQFGVDDEIDDDEFEDPGERALRMLQEQQETAQQQAEREQLDALEEQYVGEGIDALAQRDNIEPSEDEQTLIYALATNDAVRGEDGRPDVEWAYNAIQALKKEVREGYVASKKAPRIPSGRPGEKSPDLSNDDERVSLMAEMIEAAAD